MRDKEPSTNSSNSMGTPKETDWDTLGREVPFISRIRQKASSTIDAAYEKRLRPEIDTQKSILHDNNGTPTILPEFDPPNRLQKIARIATDLAPLSPPFHKKTMQRAAVSLALDENKREKKEYERKLQELERLESTQQRSDELFAQYYKKKRRVQERLKEESQELIDTMEAYRKQKTKEFQNQRALELTERKFNEVLTTPDQLAEAVLAGEDGISVSEIEYQGKKILVYDLTGYPIRWFQSAIDYKNEPGVKGYQTAQEVLADPSKYNNRLTDVKSIDEGERGMAYNVSGSYIDAQINLSRNNGVADKKLYYGFSHFPAGSLLTMYNGDNRTSQSLQESGISSYEDPDTFASSKSNGYNEVVRKRYDESGQAYPPDLMISYVRYDRKRPDLSITEETMHHAAYWQVPIIRVHRQAYIDRAVEEISRSFDGIDDNTPYPDIITVVNKEYQSNMLDDSDIIKPLNRYEPVAIKEWHEDVARHANGKFTPEAAKKICHIVEDVEPAKRLDYLESYLTSYHEGRQSALDLAITRGATRVNGERLDYLKVEDRSRFLPETIIVKNHPDYDRISRAIDQYAKNGGYVDRLRVRG